MTCYLRLRLLPDDEYHCGLECEASYDGFAGRGQAWFSRSQITAFLESLDQYPLPAPGAVLNGGYGEPTGEHVPTMQLQIQSGSPSGGRLQLVAVLADSPVYNLPDLFLRKSIVCIPLNYEMLRVFVARLRLLLCGGAPDFELELGSSA